MTQYQRSVLAIISGGACLSLLGIGMRLMEGAESNQIVFYRSVGQAVFVALFVWLQNPRKPWQPYQQLGKRGLLASLFLAAASFCMILSLVFTTVVNAVFIVSLAPLSSAILGRLVLGERVGKKTWLAIAVAIFGVAIIFGNGMSGTGVIGMGFAFCMMAFYSATLVTIRSAPGCNVLPVSAVSAAILVLVISPFVGDFSISNHDLMLCLGLGVFQVGVGLVLVIYGAQYVPTAQVSLLALLEVVLSPIWVWIGVGETPSTYALIGGAIVLAGVSIQALSKQH